MLPHIQNSQAGRDKYDVLYKNTFEVYFTLPDALREEFGQDEALLTEHVLSIGGLNVLDKAPETVEQKFMGTSRSFLQSGVDGTHADITVKLSLNLRNGTDNYIYKLLKAWNKLNYDITTGEKSLKKDYTADWLKISIGNRAGDIYREVVFKDVIMTGGLGLNDEYSYSETGIIEELEVKFRSDWWTEVNA